MTCKLVLLAAGLSRRYGAENKLLTDWRGKPLYRWTLERLAALQGERPNERTLVVVTAHPEIEADCAARGIAWVHNPRAEQGVSTSLILGLSWGAPADCTAFFVADQPRLTGETMGRFLAGYAASGRGLGCVCGQNRLGNPCVFARRYEPELLALTGDRGGKAVLRRHLEDCWLCPVADESELLDVDTPADHIL